MSLSNVENNDHSEPEEFINEINYRESQKNPSITFKELGLNSWLVDALKAMSIKFPSEIQKACIPPILKGKDCIGGAKTGSGKTAAFAFQIADQFRVLGKSINLKECVVVGGMDMMSQSLQLSRKPHVVISTPGRLVDHINSSGIAPCLSRIRFLVRKVVLCYY